MRKFKKVLAIGMALTMILGSSMAAFADDNSGSSSGAGTSEGHVEEKATLVVLPTVTGNPFAYTMDPEGLIQETAGGKYTDAVFPDSNSDTHVYFNNGTNDQSKTVYANSSAKLKVENKSSHNIKLTVSVTASAADTDIPLVAQSAIATANEPSLYLGLKVDAEAAAPITTSAAATKTVTINGAPGNFKIAVKADKSGYEYRVMTLDEYKAIDGNSAATALPWSSSEFQLEGEVTEDLKITSATTAPTVAVTWSWEDPTAAPTSYTVTYNANYEGADPATATESVNVGSNPTGPETAFSREGYTQSGWATTADGEAVALTTITEATTLYALWTADPVAATPGSFNAETTSAVISNLPEGATLTSVKYVKADNSEAALTEGTHWSYNAETNTFTVLKPALNGASYAGAKWVLTFGENVVEIPVVE